MTISRREYEEKNARLVSQDERISRLEKQVALLTEALRLSRQKRFGASSEKADAEAMEQFSFLFNEAEVLADAKAEDNVVVVPEHKRHKGYEYTLEQWPYLTSYLKDGRLELSNNRAERSIRPFALDRKNFLFANTPKGATGSAVIFSLIQTALENNLDPYRYLTWLMDNAKDADRNDPKAVERLLPWNAPEACRMPQGKK